MNEICNNIVQRSPVLIPDCLDLILNYLSNDKGTLFSCLFVNHIWCNLAVQHLWKDPFSLISSYQKVNIMHIYVASLSHKEIQQLNEKGLKIPNLVTPNFKFLYFSYLKRITYSKLEECALEWILNESKLKENPKHIKSGDKSLLSYYFEDIKDNKDNNNGDTSDEEYEPSESEYRESSEDDEMSHDIFYEDFEPIFVRHQQELSFTIFKQLILNCNKLDVLDMALFSQNSIIPNIIYIPGCHTVFSDITKFRFSQQGIHGGLGQSQIICFWNIIGYSSRNISEIEIIIDTEIDETHLSNLVNVQENLRYLTIKYTQPRVISKSFLNCMPQTLTSLELYNVKLSENSFKILHGCKNLESIQLIKCYDPQFRYLNQGDQDQMMGSENLKLEEIFWKDNIYIHYKYFVSLIKNTHNNLQEFIFIPDTNDQTGTANEILNALAQFCPNITLLAIKNVCLFYSHLVKLFKSHPWEKLVYLTLGSDSKYLTPDIALQELAPHLPASLRKLRIACEVTADNLRVFFEECQVLIEELSFPDIYYLHTDRHIEAVLNYVKEKGNLKYFDFVYSSNISQELWKNLREILKTKTLFDPFYYPSCDVEHFRDISDY